VLQGQGSDANEPVEDLCSGATWTSDISGGAILSECAPQVTFATVGPRTLTFTVTDRFGKTGGADVAINVVPDPATGPPLVSITQTTAGTLLEAETPNVLLGGAVDPDGDVPLSFRWSVVDQFGTERTIATGEYYPDVLGFAIAATWTPSTHVPFNCGGVHVDLQLEVTDSDGQTGHDEIEVFVFYPPC
jgi:hypothetical protein